MKMVLNSQSQMQQKRISVNKLFKRMFLKTCYNGAMIMSLAVTLEINKKFLPLNLFGIMNT